MNKIGSHFLMSRQCLFSFILLCYVITSENTFAGRFWHRDNMTVDYNQSDNSITFDFLIYDYLNSQKKHCLLECCRFYYTEDGKKEHVPLMNADARYLKEKDQAWIRMSNKKPLEAIRFFSATKPEKGQIWSEGKDAEFQVDILNSEYLEGKRTVTTKKSEMSIKWSLPRSGIKIQSIKVVGVWKVEGKKENFKETYYPDVTESHALTMEIDPSELNSLKSNDVRVTGETDAINVSGAEPGENIKVYTVTGTEVKSVVATDDVVNIKFAKNQMYIVKVGQESYKVALCVP